MNMRRAYWSLGFVLCIGWVSAKPINPDDFLRARDSLDVARNLVLNNTDLSKGLQVELMLKLGLWTEARQILFEDTSKKLTLGKKTDGLAVAKAHYWYLNNHYQEADQIINGVLKIDEDNRSAILLKALLYIAAWRLDEAEETVENLTKPNPLDVEALLILGRVQILRKHYAEAMDLSIKIQEIEPGNADSYLLQSEVFFWQRNMQGAEASLKRALELDPFNADARFSYGYAIWRRRDARQLRFIANQWELALSLNPLHYQTHWHWGNGYRDYSYYADPSDAEVNHKLGFADSLISIGNPEAAFEAIGEVERAHPESMLPAMLRGSAHYMAYGEDRWKHLDLAERVFLDILMGKPHYGPAHNGLAAVIKQKRMTYLEDYHLLEEEIQRQVIDRSGLFETVFPELAYYPGDRVQKMVWGSLHSARAYFPLLAKQNRTFVVQPLHKDLATALDDNFYRQHSTFDNRQWMDVRGTGGGAAGIEYAERGAHLERNVVLHEFVHLFHTEVLTDAEKRELRQLFYNARARRLTLDYYSDNNEHEYFAQTYEAYFSERKVHPLNHKSMNTRFDLESKDPQAFAFIQNLVAKEKASLEGDTLGFRSNWAQVYLNLSEAAREESTGGAPSGEAEACLDSALMWDPNYLPALLSYAQLRISQKRMLQAKAWLARAERTDPYYAPIYQVYGQFTQALLEEGFITEETAIQKEVKFYTDAYERENDLLISAQINQSFREFYAKNCLWIEALEVADRYIENAPTVSSYLVDHQDDALAFSSWIRGNLGYFGPSGQVFTKLLARKPQNLEYQKMYSEVLANNGRHKKAIQILEGTQRFLSSAGDLNTDLMTRIAEIYLMFGDAESARQAMEPVLINNLVYHGDRFRLIRVLAGTGEMSRCRDELDQLTFDRSSYNLAEYNYTLGMYWKYNGDEEQANQYFREALAFNPYQHNSRMALIRSMAKTTRKDQAIGLLQQAMQLDLPWPPEFAARAYDYINQP